jgi:radical SAM superfamily enzyme YgiQ (UPF0313 family)
VNVLLVYPEFPDTFWSFKHALKFIRKPASQPPLGLLTVAAMLPAEWRLRFVDLNVRALSDADLAWADCAFISAMAVQRASAEQIIARCGAAGVRTVAGGPLFTSQFERFAAVDHLVLNEAEATLPPFLEDLARGRPRRTYARAEHPDLRDSPAPRWDLVDLDAYASMPIQFSRGCPYDCEFCDVTALFGHRPRVKRAPQIIAELDGLYDLGWRGPVFFVDDNLIANKKSFETDLLPALLEWRKRRRGGPFHTQVSINLADDERLMQTMAAAGFGTVFVGIETPEEEGLVECSKKQNLGRDLVADVKRIQRAGIEVRGGFIIGFDSDSPGTIERLLNYVQQSGIATAMVGLLQALPGTRLYDRMQRAGRLVEQGSGDNVDGTTNIVPALGLEVLRGAYKDALQRLYAPRAYYRRVRTFLREYRPPRLKLRLDVAYLWEQAAALARSVVRLGIVGRERLEYWKLLTWTLFRRPRAFSLAVTLAIYGYHFRTVCELHVE